MSNDKILAAIERLQADTQLVHLQLSKGALFGLIGQIQLACRHPANKGPSRIFAEQVARQLGEAISANDPELRDLIEAGWQPQRDVRR